MPRGLPSASWRTGLFLFSFVSSECSAGKSFLSSQVLLTPTHLGIVMEYAAGGELFERICNAGRFSEDEVEESFNPSISNAVFKNPESTILISPRNV